MIYIWAVMMGVGFVVSFNAYRKTKAKLVTAMREIGNLNADIDALEIGKDELQDTYEQQFLSHLEKISLLTVLNAEQEETIKNLEMGIELLHQDDVLTWE